MNKSITRIEIQKQPEFITETLLTEGDHAIEIARKITKDKIHKMFFVGCGSSYCASLLAKYLSDSLTNNCSDALNGYEFTRFPPMSINKKAYVFLTSFSGESEDIIQALQLAKKHKIYTIGVTCIKNSTLHKEVDEPVLLRDFNLASQGPMVGGYSTQVAWFYWLIGHISKLSLSHNRTEQILQQFMKLPQILRVIIEDEEKKMAELAKNYKEEQGFYVIGSGPLYSLAYKLAHTMITENVFMHGSVVTSGEFRHGLIEKIEKRVPVILLLGYRDSMTERVLRFVRSHEAETIVFNANHYSRMDEAFLPLLLSIPTEWFTYYLSLEKGRLPEYRRYMNKEPF